MLSDSVAEIISKTIKRFKNSVLYYRKKKIQGNHIILSNWKDSKICIILTKKKDSVPLIKLGQVKRFSIMN